MTGPSKASLARRQQRREEVGRRIAAARDGKNWSQETLGKQLGLMLKGEPYTARSIARIEAGDTALTFEMADAIGALLGVDPREFMPAKPVDMPLPRTAAPERKRQPSPPAQKLPKRAAN